MNYERVRTAGINGRLAAAEAIAEIRSHGGFVLRIRKSDGEWVLRVQSYGAPIPKRVTDKLDANWQYAMILLRELVTDDTKTEG